MKNFLILALVVVTLPALAQKDKVKAPYLPVDTETGQITYLGKTELVNVTAQDLYDRAYNWATGYYKNATEKLRVQDKDNGRMEIFARFKIYAHDKKGEVTTSQIALVQYSFDIDFKDNKYRYVIHKINERAASYLPVEQWQNPDDPDVVNNTYKLIDMDAEIKSVINSFQTAMTTAPKSDGDDW